MCIIKNRKKSLLIAKLKAYGFSKEGHKLMKGYLKNRKQKIQINNKFSSERDVIAGNKWSSLESVSL